MSYKDIMLLSIGRHFENSRIILGKNKEENAILQKEQGIKIIPKEPGATALIRTENKNERADLIEKAKSLIKKYSKHEISGFEVIED